MEYATKYRPSLCAVGTYICTCPDVLMRPMYTSVDPIAEHGNVISIGGLCPAGNVARIV